MNVINKLMLALMQVLVMSTILPAQQEPVSENKATSANLRFFSERIEPLLKSKCYGCHSHVSGTMEGGLTLDSRSGWAEGGERGPAIIPGKPEKSLLVKVVLREDSELEMPPDEPLSDEEIDLLKEWVKHGASDPRTAKPVVKETSDPTDWWSLRPLQSPAVPGPTEKQISAENVIDAFVQRRLLEKNITPTPRADRKTLIRRLYYDLHGLPPTPEAVDKFVADPDPQAYEKLVDQLLNSERYGERWARHWLDTVHFADSHGCEHDVFRPNAWRYRDYVIASFNRDTKWSRFIREQLATDRFHPDEPQLLPALGFIAAGPLELSRAGTAPVTFDYLDRDDMVAQTMAAFTSTTVNCARCHDHKFDPISQEDYYSMQAVFAGIGKGDIKFDDDPQVVSERRHLNELQEATESGDQKVLLAKEYTELVTRWEEEFGHQPAVWLPLSPNEVQSSDGSTLKPLADNSILASGDRPERDTYTITAQSSLKNLTALRLEVLSDESFPMKGPGRQDNGNLHLSEFEAFVIEPGRTEKVPLKIRKAKADWDQDGWTSSHAIDGNIATAWGIYPKVGATHFVVFELDDPVVLKPSSQIVVVLKQLHGNGHLIGRARLYETDAPGASAKVLPDLILEALKVPRDQRSDEQHVAIAAHALRIYADEQLARLPSQLSVYAVSNSYSRAAKQPSPLPPKTVHVLRRGNIDKPGEIAFPGAISVVANLPGRFDLPNMNDEAARRASMADWISSRDNPLTWRSIVNRTWSYHFGRGLCGTPNDMGRMGDTPSHPELLDWLAVWFRDDAKGSLKQLHRLILLSSTWQRATSMPNSVQNEASSLDANNRLLWRMNRRRLDAESYRDSVLQISGRIDLTMGGAGIQQFTQSKGAQATPKLDYDAFDWNHPSAARRSIYRVVWRGISDPFMESLDFPDLGLLSPKRGESVSSLQALSVFNNDFVLHHSEVLADSLESTLPTIEDQVAQACRLIYLREPRTEDHALLNEYAQKHGLAATCRILLNSNEFLFIE